MIFSLVKAVHSRGAAFSAPYACLNLFFLWLLFARDRLRLLVSFFKWRHL